MSKFQSAIGTISALVTISVTVGTVYYNFENKKSQDVNQQQQINQLQQKLNRTNVVEERTPDAILPAPEPRTPSAPEPRTPSAPEPRTPSAPELPAPVVQSEPEPPVVQPTTPPPVPTVPQTAEVK